MIENEKKEWKKLYELGERFAKKKPWKKFGEDNLFQVSFSKERTGYFSINGRMGMDRGFSLFLGEEGYNQFLGMFDVFIGDLAEDVYWSKLNCLRMDIIEEDELPEEQENLIQQLEIQFKDGQAIIFTCLEEGYIPYVCSMDEVRVLTMYLEKMLEGYDLFLKQKTKNPEQLSIYSYAMDKDSWNGDFIELPSQDFVIPIEKASDLNVHVLNKCKKTNMVWEIEERPLLTPLMEDSYKKPIQPNLVVIMDHNKNEVLANDISSPETYNTLLMDILVDTIKKKGLPKKMLINNSYVNAKVQDLCVQIGIQIEYSVLECCNQFYDGLNENMDFIDNMDDNMAEVFQKMEQKGIDLKQMKKDVEQMSETEFTQKYADEVADMLSEMFDIEFEDDLPFGEEDWEDDDYQIFEFQNRKEKINAILDYFGTGKMYGDEFEEREKYFEYDYAEATWKELLTESSKQELIDMAEKMGALLNDKMRKEELIAIIIAMYSKRNKNLYDLLSDNEFKFLKSAEKNALKMNSVTLMDDIAVSKEELIHMLSLGLVDLYVEYEEGEFVMNIEIIDEVNWSRAKK